MTAPEASAATANAPHDQSTATPEGEAALRVADLTVSYQQKPVLRRVALDVQLGQMVAIAGPNGAGKSTFLKATLGLIPRDAGTVHIFGRPLEQARRLIAYVPQTEDADWDFPITVREVVLMGRYGHLGLWGRPRARDWDVVQECLDTVGMGEFADRHIRQLSGGQQQRVFLARALAQEARVLLLDEPFSGVDARTEEAILDLMDRFSQGGKTLVVVSHNLQSLERFHAVLLLNQAVMAFGTPREVLTPDHLRRAYGGRMAYIDEAERVLREGAGDVE